MAIAHPLVLLAAGTASPLAAVTTALTTIASIADAHTTPDYAFSATTNSSAYGCGGVNEIITLLYIVQNLQVRVAEIQARLVSLGLTL